jgi:hypothetical protein
MEIWASIDNGPNPESVSSILIYTSRGYKWAKESSAQIMGGAK